MEMGKGRYLGHESYLRKCNGKLVRVIMDKVIQTCAVLNCEFRSCLLDWVIIDFLTYFLKYATFDKRSMNENGYDKWLGLHFIDLLYACCVLCIHSCY